MATKVTKKTVQSDVTPDESAILEAEISPYDISDVKQGMIDVGIQLCKEVLNGRARDIYKNIDAVIGIYTAIK